MTWAPKVSGKPTAGNHAEPRQARRLLKSHSMTLTNLPQLLQLVALALLVLGRHRLRLTLRLALGPAPKPRVLPPARASKRRP
jgi:hypothetical protein